MKKTDKVPAPEQEVQKEAEEVKPTDETVEQPITIENVVEETIIPAPEQEVQKVQEPLVHTTTAVLSTVISTARLNTDRDPNIVEVIINYPDGYTGTRFFKNGDVKEVSKEGAADFVKKGIASYKK